MDSTCDTPSTSTLAPVTRKRRASAKPRGAPDGKVIAESEPEGTGTFDQLVDVVTSVMQGLENVDESELKELLPNISYDFIKVAADAKAHQRAEPTRRGGPLTRGRLGTGMAREVPPSHSF
jgi:hypothetical protein